MVDKLEAVRDVCDFYLGDCQRCGKRADRFNQDEPCPRGPWLPAARTPANGEQVERIYVQWSDDGQHIRKWSRTPFDAGAPLDATPTEDARSRVKVLEEALKPFAAVAEYMGNKDGIVTGYNHVNVTREHFRRARTALGNKDTDRHG